MRTLVEYADALSDAANAQDFEAYDEALKGIIQVGAAASREQADAALGRIRPLVETLPLSLAAGLARVAANLCLYGSDINVLVPVFVERACVAMDNTFVFNMSWDQLIGRPWPQPAREQAAIPDMRRFVDVACSRGVDKRQAVEIAEAWAFAGAWVQPVLFLAQYQQVRAALPQRERLTEVVGVARHLFEQAHFLHGLLHVLDDEPLIVLHRQTGRGFRLRLTGVADHRQLHTLLAGLLIGPESPGGLPGRRPADSELVAATTGEVLDLDEPITGTIILNDAAGEWVWNGIPAGIATVDGVRVVVIDPPTVERTWKTARIYPYLEPRIEFEGELASHEAATWLSRCAPPKRVD
ncbi:hypothetical protein [Catellatospora tritici]|uniref:hypothetical protein n=1 Tax=Catellatospora tritici TaxID=2851566 RepID=UPI001C2CF25F|nr:hypothetical protein [Catellatospora tritici]MBV1855556.1 hypothetical protein [Catellatospora tritici]